MIAQLLVHFGQSGMAFGKLTRRADSSPFQPALQVPWAISSALAQVSVPMRAARAPPLPPANLLETSRLLEK